MKTNNKPSIKGVRISNVEIVYKNDEYKEEKPYYGALSVTHEGRMFIWDTYQSYTDKLIDNRTSVTLDLEVDTDMFGDCFYDLTLSDLFESSDRTLFIEGEDDTEIESIDLFFTTIEDDHYHSVPVEEEN